MMGKNAQTIQIAPVEHSEFFRAMTLMKGCHYAAGDYHEPNSLLITGQTGTGKSTLVAHYLRNAYSQKGILAINMPQNATIKNFINALFEKLGCDSGKGSSIHHEAVRLVEVIKEKEIGLLIIDEFQQIMDSNDNKINLEVLDLLKQIQIDAKVSIIAVGLPICQLIVKQNPQLARRFSFHFDFTPFRKDEDKKAFKQFLQKVEEQLSCKFSLQISNDESLKQLIDATDGLVEKTITLIVAAYQIAVSTEKKEIGLEELADAFSALPTLNNGKENPFNRKAS
jgi:type II secretory pathway predicted ATPase ExeA